MSKLLSNMCLHAYNEIFFKSFMTYLKDKNYISKMWWKDFRACKTANMTSKKGKTKIVL